MVSAFDINEFQFVIKEDLFGLGYKRLDVSNLFGSDKASSVIQNESPAASLLFPMGAPDQKKKGITGQVISNLNFCLDRNIPLFRDYFCFS